MTIPNVAPADELAALRASIKDLQQREAELRNLLLADPGSRTGNRFVAEIRTVEQNRPDIKEMRKMHPEIVEQYTFPFEVKTVVLKAIDQDTGEIVPIPKRVAGGAA